MSLENSGSASPVDDVQTAAHPLPNFFISARVNAAANHDKPCVSFAPGAVVKAAENGIQGKENRSGKKKNGEREKKPS